MNDAIGTIFDIKRFAIFDGPGIRTTIFMKGCPLHCIWCHNPEGISPKKELITYTYKCIECQQCIPTCPTHAITCNNHQVKTNFNTCTHCGSCIDICPSSCRQLIGKNITITTLIKEINKDIIFYKESSGGVTFSGGEPLMQPHFLKPVLQNLKKQGIHTTLDTSGYAPPPIFTSLLSSTNLLLYDLKILNNTKHQKYTGVPNTLIKSNLKTAINQKIPVIIRFTIIPDITDTDQNIQELITYTTSLKIKEINLLPYHNVQEKYTQLGKTYHMPKSPTRTQDKIMDIKEKCEHAGIYTIIGG